MVLNRTRFIGHACLTALGILVAAAVEAQSAGTSATGTSVSVSPAGTLELASDAQGVRVVRVSGSALLTGVCAGDLLAAIDGARIQTPEDLMAVLRSGVRSGGGKEHRLQILRAGQTVMLAVTSSAWRPYLTPRPPAPPAPTVGPPAPPAPPSTP